MIKKTDIKQLLKRKEVSIPLGFIAAGLIATVSWLIFMYGTVRTDNAKIDGNIIYISSDTAGIVAGLPKSEFNEVSLGETVAEINPLLGTAERLKGSENLSAFSTLAGMKKEIENLSDKLTLAEKNFGRKKALFESGGISRQELDGEATSLSILRSQVDSARDLYDMAGNILAITEADTPYIPLKSPINGRFAKKLVDLGEIVTAGQPVCAVVDLENIWVTAKINEDKVAEIRVGQPVKITVDTYPGEVFKGEVLDVGVAANAVFSLIPQDNVSGSFIKVTQTISVRISIDPRGFILRPGSNVTVTIYTK
ncbi:MAG: HlyD family secretion protein [Deltaproteobacteria bacterium]|nr:HlyD family secretion protein [Candidatus Zymogenaceae bacterium]